MTLFKKVKMSVELGQLQLQIQKVNVGAGSDGMGKKCVFRSLLYKDLIQALKASGISRK